MLLLHNTHPHTNWGRSLKFDAVGAIPYHASLFENLTALVNSLTRSVHLKERISVYPIDISQ